MYIDIILLLIFINLKFMQWLIRTHVYIPPTMYLWRGHLSMHNVVSVVYTIIFLIAITII